METALVPEKKLSLRELTDQLVAWKDTLEGMGDNDVDVALIRAKLAHIEAMHHDKVDRMAAFLRWLPQMQAELASDESRFMARRRAYERLESRRRADLTSLLKENGVSQLAGRCSTISLCAGKERVEITDASQLPEEFVDRMAEVVIPAHTKPNLESIGMALRAGKQVPGAKLTRGDPHISVR